MQGFWTLLIWHMFCWDLKQMYVPETKILLIYKNSILLYYCNESGLCGSPWSSPEVTITRLLTSLSELHFPSSCNKITLVACSPDAHLWDYLSHTHREVLYCRGWRFWAFTSFSVWSLCFDSGLFLSFRIDICLPFDPLACLDTLLLSLLWYPCYRYRPLPVWLC